MSTSRAEIARRCPRTRSSLIVPPTGAPDASHMADRRVMFEAMRNLAAEQGRALDDDTRFTALAAIWRACEEQRRCLVPDEIRVVVGDAWELMAR